MALGTAWVLPVLSLKIAAKRAMITRAPTAGNIQILSQRLNGLSTVLKGRATVLEVAAKVSASLKNFNGGHRLVGRASQLRRALRHLATVFDDLLDAAEFARP